MKRSKGANLTLGRRTGPIMCKRRQGRSLSADALKGATPRPEGRQKVA